MIQTYNSHQTTARSLRRYLLIGISFFVSITLMLYELKVQHVVFKLQSSKLYYDTKELSDTLLLNPKEIRYIYGAYLIYSQRTSNAASIRLLIVQNCGANSKDINITLNNGSRSLVGHFTPTNAACPWHYNPGCTWGGYWWQTKHGIQVDNNSTTPTITISYPHRTVTLPPTALHTVIESNSRSEPHRLVVCLQPLFLVTDWRGLVEFIEVWLVLGVEKFFIYWQSVSTDVLWVLNELYVKYGIVELRPWPSLPQVSFEFNPNSQLYRTDVFSSVNECVLRSIGVSTYVALIDVDEIVGTISRKISTNFPTLPNLLDLILEMNPKTGAFLFRSRTSVRQVVESTTDNSTGLDFSYLSNFEVSNHTWPAGSMSKLVVMPQRVQKVHIHQVLQFSKTHGASSGSKQSYTLFDMTNLDSDYTVFHFRKILNETRFVDEKFHSHTMLKPLADVLNSKQRPNFDATVKHHKCTEFESDIAQQMNECVSGFDRKNVCVAAPVLCRDRMPDVDWLQPSEDHWYF